MIFKDKRLYLWNHNQKSKFIYSDKISGGISGWRKIIFKKINFDKKNNFHLFEDVDFSVRVNKIWPKSTIVTTSAKVVHKWSKINRNKDIKLLELKLIEAYKFYKKNDDNFFNTDFLIFILGAPFYLLRQVSVSIMKSKKINNNDSKNYTNYHYQISEKTLIHNIYSVVYFVYYHRNKIL